MPIKVIETHFRTVADFNPLEPYKDDEEETNGGGNVKARANAEASINVGRSSLKVLAA
ncbi:MAG: hypothetical protein JO253_08635 [Alphaproteobacteria bacterium]|nr:hypothetical protein [Alphaproteobacteria bacterium]